MKQSDKCECKHALLVHLSKCQVKGCKCRKFEQHTHVFDDKTLLCDCGLRSSDCVPFMGSKP